jgi:hypothetical protein
VGTLFIVMLVVFAGRAITCFARGRTFAGLFAAAACLLFLGGLYADFADHHKAKPQAARRAV